ncbi:MAG TPA: hypothetical protein VNG93_09775 [Candidatus Dormibacteraeota bacterium]|nr:hypothetical protein [Candidatus Dormibacteraeota bacterium]
MHLEGAGARIDLVAEREKATIPATAGGLALHSGDHPIDHGRALELGEDAEHLDHHSAGWGASVEGLGRRAEGDTSPIQLIEDLGQTAD